MTDKDRGAKAPPTTAAVTNLRALDLALQSQALELERLDLARALLPLFEHIERVCRGFDRLPGDLRQQRADAVAMLAEVADAVRKEIDIERIGEVGERAERDRHDIVDARPSPAGHGTVLEVVQFGWSSRGRVLQPARVVAALPSNEAPEAVPVAAAKTEKEKTQ